MTGELNRQQLCAALNVSESTLRRLVNDGLPCTPVGVRGKRFDLAECKAWLRVNQCQTGSIKKQVAGTSALWSAANDYTASCRQVHLRVMPSK